MKPEVIRFPVETRSVQGLQDKMYLMNAQDHDLFCKQLFLLLNTNEDSSALKYRNELKQMLYSQ